MFVYTAGKADLQHLADRGMGSIAAGDIDSLARLLLSIWPFDISDDATRGILELYELGAAFDLHAGLAQALHQQALVFVLRKDERVRKWAESCAHFAEYGMSRSLAGHPEIRGHRFPPALNYRISEADLVVELERSRLHSQRARRRSWLGRLVDDPHPYAQPRQPKGQHQ